jgi:single-stranded-DNA-specific exonuclease
MSLAQEIGAGLAAWVEALPQGRSTRVHVLCDSDADGLPAGALLVRMLRAAGFDGVSGAPRCKGESAWGAPVLERLRKLEPGALIVADLGSRSEPLLGPEVPTLLIDHHMPLGAPEGAVLLTAYGTGAEGGDGKDVATTGLLAWWCARALCGEERAAEWLWLAGISLLSDLGDKAPFPELAEAKKRFGGGALRDATSLLNAPRRTAAGDGSAGFRLLLKADGPKAVTSGEFPETAELLRAKEEVGAALASARKMPPRFSKKVREELGADLVAIRMETPCQVHPLVAQQWRGRFPKSVVFGVNTGYRPGWVHFSGRAPAGVNLLEFLARHRPEEADTSYGLGHNQASGGALPVPVWNRFAEEIGFGPEMQVADGEKPADREAIAEGVEEDV